jgi:integrase
VVSAAATLGLSRVKVRYPFFLEKVWNSLLRRAKLPYRPYHSTRHSFATCLLEGGANLWAAARGGMSWASLALVGSSFPGNSTNCP